MQSLTKTAIQVLPKKHESLAKLARDQEAKLAQKITSVWVGLTIAVAGFILMCLGIILMAVMGFHAWLLLIPVIGAIMVFVGGNTASNEVGKSMLSFATAAEIIIKAWRTK